ncbi:MAG: DUF1501 domain-containing protein [Pirellulaceae bacterium]|nr:DUF1501 domain-containing protein [Pirellulaceae bacterium]
MLRILDPAGMRLCDGLSRRDWLRIGGIGLGGLALPSLLSQPARAGAGTSVSFGKAKSVIVVGLIGGPPQHETWDPKPDAPAEIRGEFGVIPSKTPGLFIGELMPKTAALTDKIAVLRAVVTGDNAHSSSGYQMLTGIPHVPLNQESATPKPPNDWPTLGAMVRAIRQRRGELPAAITLPEHIWNDGNFPWPGQDAGLLGKQHHPWLLHCDPSAADFSIPGLALPAELPPIRFDSRRSLLAQMNQRLEALAGSGAVAGYDVHAQKAFELLSASSARDAFDIGKEPESVRERYGRSRFAQSLLLARRLVEAGVSLVQVNWTRIKDQPNQGGWDTHADHNKSLKSLLMPTMDQCYSALLEDLSQRGLLESTLVVWFGEFGRTPKFNAKGGRDHWGRVFSLALAGGGIRGGVVHGKSDRLAGEPVEGEVRAKDLIATIFHCLGFEPEHLLHDPTGRPLPLSRGRGIEEILA